jgi:nucleotide-binding universal stress UspA family protein
LKEGDLIMIKKILVATDASEYSQRALEKAIEYAKKFQSEIILIHVFTQPRSYGTFTGLPTIEYSEDEVNQIGKKIFDITLEGIDTSGVNIEKKTVIGHPATSILKEINEEVDLVVMGSKGHGPLSGTLIGSVTQRVLGLAPCSVLVVK